MIEFEIVPMTTEKEMDEKGYVHYKSWQETYSTLMPDEFLQSITLDKCIKMAHKWTQNTLLLKVDNKTVGFSCFGESRECKDDGEIIALYLLEKWQGKKLGYSLMKATCDKLQEKHKLVLWVLKGNDKAINFYKRYGFEFTGKEKSAPFGTELQMAMKK